MPDLIFYNGSILTMDASNPRVSALAVRGGRILALGTAEEMLALARRDTERIDLEGRCLLPGFHDSHVHLSAHGLELSRLNLSRAETLEEGLELIQSRAAELPAGEWLLGSGFSTSRWDVQALAKEPLDRVAPHHPVFLRSQDHHSAWVNSAALARAGVNADTPDPPNGAILRDAGGEPNGGLLEHAAALISRAVPPPGDAALGEAVRRAGGDLARLGITTVHHMAYEAPDGWRMMAHAASRDDYPLRVWACIDQENAEHAAAIGLSTGQGGSRFMIGGAKFFADGALGSLTAWMLEPYSGTDERGMPVHGPEVLAERLPVVIAAGLTPVTHAIGDAANRAILDALAATKSLWAAKGLRPRVEHAQHLHPDDVPRFGELGVVASLQPYHLVFDAKRIKKLLPDRMGGAYAMRSLLASNAPLAFGSDTPVADPDVRLGLLAACRRLGADGEVLNPQELLSPDDALLAYTRGAAYAIGREERSGRLRPGFDADLTILSHDPLVSLDGLEVMGAMLAGAWTRPLD